MPPRDTQFKKFQHVIIILDCLYSIFILLLNAFVQILEMWRRKLLITKQALQRLIWNRFIPILKNY
jgi:hypothetical protein